MNHQERYEEGRRLRCLAADSEGEEREQALRALEALYGRRHYVVRIRGENVTVSDPTLGDNK